MEINALIIVNKFSIWKTKIKNKSIINNLSQIGHV